MLYKFNQPSCLGIQIWSTVKYVPMALLHHMKEISPHFPLFTWDGILNPAIRFWINWNPHVIDILFVWFSMSSVITCWIVFIDTVILLGPNYSFRMFVYLPNRKSPLEIWALNHFVAIRRRIYANIWQCGPVLTIWTVTKYGSVHFQRVEP